MRATFAKLLEQYLDKQPNAYFLTADLGYKYFDNIREKYPSRVFNTGAAEQLMIGTAVGLAHAGKIPICYSITPFLLYRPYEIIRNYINYEKVNVKLIGSGRDKDYSHDGFSHWAEDDGDVLKNFPNIQPYWFDSKEELEANFEQIMNSPIPTYINLKR